MLDGQYTSQSAETPPQVSQLDLEFSGLLNRASSQGAKFGLLLAMLQQNYLERPAIAQPAVESESVVPVSTSHYPKIPLAAHSKHWQQADIATATMHNDGIKSAHLWLTMHPQPLSLHNDATQIDQDVLANCDIYTQQRHSDDFIKIPELEVDEVGIYDLLQDIGLDMQSAA